MGINFCNFVFLVFFINQVHLETVDEKYFLCNTGIYIPNHKFCDGKKDCTDGSDEAYGCNVTVCGTGKFQCTNGPCFSITTRCNTKNDCADGSDELNCVNNINHDQCSLSDGRFSCNNGSKCVYFHQICNDQCDCDDCSDEEEGCQKYYEYLCKACSYACSPYPKGDHLYENSSKSDSHFYCRATTADQFTLCDQRMTSFVWHSNREWGQCLCDENYDPVLGQNETKPGMNGYRACVNRAPYENLLIFCNTDEVRAMNLTTEEFFTIRNGIQCTALHAAHGFAYYGTFVNNKGHISKTSISTKETHDLIESDSKITSIGVDWITNNIYYTTDKSISVCSHDGKSCEKLKSCAECNVVVAPKFGFMLWSSKQGDHPFIRRSSLDGSNEIMLHQTYLSTGTFKMSLDESSALLFLGNPDYISLTMLGFQGVARRHSPNWQCSRGKVWISFTEFENQIFHSEANDSSIYKTKSKDSAESFPLKRDPAGKPITLLHAYNPRLQRTKTSNPCATASCEGLLCLLRPSSNFKGLEHSCV